jgi:hypothetical protein
MEDRSKDVILFGPSEIKDENVEKCIKEVFQEIGLKPSLQASRVGKINETRKFNETHKSK